MISIKDNSLLHVDAAIPSIPNGMFGLQGAKLPNGDLLVCGGSTRTGLWINDVYALQTRIQPVEESWNHEKGKILSFLCLF